MVRQMKEPHKVSYKILRTVLYPIYMLYYRPTIINKENIPKDGPVIICCNHIHLFDQNTAILSTKRMIHYMAKKEHLDGTFGLLFKLAGCIRVDREIHDEIAKKEAIDLLNNNYIVGLFPEGTRNQLHGKKELNKKLYNYYKDKMTYKKYIKILKQNMVKISQLDLLNKLLEENRITENDYINNALNIDKYLKELLKDNLITMEEYQKSILLPIKYGAVSLASKTNAYILPCAVTGKYKFRNNNLTLEFGIPFKVDDINNLELYKNKLENSIIQLIESNN